MGATSFDIGPTRAAAAPPAKSLRWPPSGATIVAWLLGASTLVLFIGAHLPSGPADPAPVAPQAPPPPAWVDIDHPMELFDLSAPDLAQSERHYYARRHRMGGGRQDMLVFGDFDGAQPYLRLTLYRVGSETVPQSPLFVALARMAAQAGLSIVRSLSPAALETRFGSLEAADIDLAASTGATTPCLGFRGSALAGGFRMSGLACGTPARPLSQPALGCILDRLDLNSAGDDQALAEFFAASELRRDASCAGTVLAPTPSRTSWIDQADAPPPLKLRKTP